MTADEIYVRALLAQYRVFRLELIIFTIIFILAMLIIPVAWIVNHVYHDFRLGCILGLVPTILGLCMAVHCGNILNVLRGITANLNRMMGDRLTFDYDQDQETETVRYLVTLAAKVIGCLLLLWCFISWPQL